MLKIEKDKMLILKNNQSGSALVLVIMLLVSSLLVVSSITTISAIERKNSEKAKNSAPSFQAADAGIEWALSLTADVKPDRYIENIFDEVDCVQGTDLDCKIYFVDKEFKVIDKALYSETQIGEVAYIRSIGYFGQGESRVSRALETSLILSREPMGFWKIDDSSDTSGATIIDSSSNRLDGKDKEGIAFYNDITTHCSEKANSSCATWDSSDKDFVLVGHDSNLDFEASDNFTITTWFRHGSTNPEAGEVEYLLSKTENLTGYALYYDEDGFINFAVNEKTSSLSLGETFDNQSEDKLVANNNNDAGYGDGSWYFVVAIWDGDSKEMRLFVDNDNLYTKSPVVNSSGSFENDGNFLIGAINNSGVDGEEESFFNGYLDDIRVYDYALTEAQISKYYDDGPS